MWRCLFASLVLLLGLAPPPGRASASLALDKGCFNCHGDPPRRGAPTFAQLAADHAKYRDQPDAPRRLAEKLRAGSLFAHVDSHERLNQDECETLMRWIIDGAR